MFSSFLSDDAGETIFLHAQPVLEPHFRAIYGNSESNTVRADVVTQFFSIYTLFHTSTRKQALKSNFPFVVLTNSAPILDVEAAFPLIHCFLPYIRVFFFPSPRFQKEGVQGEAGDRHHSQLHQQEHHCGSQSGGDQRRGVHLQPEILPGS